MTEPAKSRRPCLPPTALEDEIERRAMNAVREIVGRDLTVREKRKIEGLEIYLQCEKCRNLIRPGHLHKCLYCDKWFCVACAEKHFGKTIREYKTEKLAKPHQP